jgi:ferredoxin
VFRVDDDDQVQVILPRPGTELRAAIEAAVARCPRQALSLDEENAVSRQLV